MDLPYTKGPKNLVVPKNAGKKKLECSSRPFKVPHQSRKSVLLDAFLWAWKTPMFFVSQYVLADLIIFHIGTCLNTVTVKATTGPLLEKKEI